MNSVAKFEADPWTAIGGIDAARDKLVETLVTPLREGAAMRRLGIRAARGIMLYGPPGVGKTLLVRAAAHAAGAALVQHSAPEVLAAGEEGAADALRTAFAAVRSISPAILFIDELELLAPARVANTAEPHRSESVVNTLLVELDRLADMNSVILVGSTSRPNSVDPALLRPGRFDELIYVPVPDMAGRAAILAVQTAKVKLAKNVDVAALAARTDRFTAADLDDLIRRAGLRAILQSRAAKAIAMADFEAALAETHASVTEAMEKEYEKVQGAIKQNALKLATMGFFGPGDLKPVRDSKHGANERG
jgi:transitional endoplasmic reticulum ATPase